MDPADQLYEGIRRDERDVESIAEHTGWKPRNIEKIKRHLFRQIHQLDSYENLGVPSTMDRFDGDREIASSWP